jgi:hypothetical protein
VREFVHIVIQYTAEQRSRSCNFPPSSKNLIRHVRSLAKAKRQKGTKQQPDLISHCFMLPLQYLISCYLQVASKFQCAATPWHSRGSCRPNCAAPTTSPARYLLAMDVNCPQSNSNMSYFLLLHCTSIFIELERAKWAHLWQLSIVNDGAAIERRHGHETTVAIQDKNRRKNRYCIDYSTFFRFVICCSQNIPDSYQVQTAVRKICALEVLSSHHFQQYLVPVATTVQAATAMIMEFTICNFM